MKTDKVVAALIATGIGALLVTAPWSARASAQSQAAPAFAVDPTWPKPLPNNWVLGPSINVAVDRRDHVWTSTASGSCRPS